MTQLDERILEQLTTDGAATSWEVRFELTGTVSSGRMTERCNTLIDADLLERKDSNI